MALGSAGWSDALVVLPMFQRSFDKDSSQTPAAMANVIVLLSKSTSVGERDVKIAATVMVGVEATPSVGGDRGSDGNFGRDGLSSVALCQRTFAIVLLPVVNGGGTRHFGQRPVFTGQRGYLWSINSGDTYMPSPSNQIKLRRFLIGMSLLFILVAMSSNMIGLTRGPIGKDRLMLGSVGVLLLCMAVLGRRFLNGYRWVALNAANSIVLLLALEIGATLIHRVTPAADVAHHVAAREVGSTSVERQLYVGWRARQFSGDAINIDGNGTRLTPPERGTDETRATKIFAFGGSTMWGEGAADNETIPAYLQKRLCENGTPVRVTNFGQRAWVATQSLMELTIQLHRGNVPDVVVFYDGYNETTAAYSTGQAGVPENFEGLLANNGRFANLLAGFFGNTDLCRLILPRREFVAPQIDTPAMAKAVVTNYAAVHQSVSALAATYDFDVHFYWQPQLYGGLKPLTEEEQAIANQHPWLPDSVRELSDETYRLAGELAASRETITDISDAFSAVQQRVYIDPCHVLPVGNLRIADVMLEAGLRESVIERFECHPQTTSTDVDVRQAAG